MKTRLTFVRDLAATVYNMYLRGNFDISLQDICKEYYDDKRYGAATLNDIRHRLSQIKRVLINEYHLDVILLSPHFWHLYGGFPPNNAYDAKKCLPVGSRQQAEGLHISTTSNDILMQTDLQYNCSSAEGKRKKYVDRGIVAITEKRLTPTAFKQIVDNTTQRYEPNNPAFVKTIMSLPSLPITSTEDSE